MIVLFTDFGVAGHYVGQMKAAILREAPRVPVVDLQHDAPAFEPRRAAYLLAALTGPFPSDAVFVCVVDPGVGGVRDALIVEADGRLFVGPDNGLFELVMRQARTASAARLLWRPPDLSASFHGRDLFAPAAARLARGMPIEREALSPDAARHPDWPDDLAEVIYLDAYGNALTGYRASGLPERTILSVGGTRLERTRTFSDVPAGTAFWYENSAGLIEFAVNGGSAAHDLSLAPGTAFTIDSGGSSA